LNQTLKGFLRWNIPLINNPGRIQRSIISIVTDGNATIQVDGIKYTLEKGMILSVFPQQVIEHVDNGHYFRLMYFTCSTEILKRILFRFPPEFEFFLKEYPTYKLPDDVFESYKSIIRLMNGFYSEKKNISKTEIILSFIRIIHLEIYNKTHQKLRISPIRQIRQHELFRKFIELLVVNCKNNREVQYYADKLNITPKYLSSVTMEIKLLLKSTELTIQEIMLQFNFQDQAFLTKFFKNNTGMTPKQYRNL